MFDTVLQGWNFGKGDHRHYGEREEPYFFVSKEQLMTDFLADVEQFRGQHE